MGNRDSSHSIKEQSPAPSPDKRYDEFKRKNEDWDDKVRRSLDRAGRAVKKVASARTGMHVR